MCVFYFTVVFTAHITIPLNYTFIGPELFFSCSTGFKNNFTLQISEWNDALELPPLLQSKTKRSNFLIKLSITKTLLKKNA